MKRAIHPAYRKGLYKSENFTAFMVELNAEGHRASLAGVSSEVYHLGEPYHLTLLFQECHGISHLKIKPFTQIILMGNKESIEKLELRILEESSFYDTGTKNDCENARAIDNILSDYNDAISKRRGEGV